jgi:16S rRNA G966 N2-methylase RsmD
MVQAAKHRRLHNAVADGQLVPVVAGRKALPVDSLLVMNSLLEKEAMAGHVQVVYFDPPYGTKYDSNFQPFVNKRDVKDGRDEDLTTEPEMIKAFRDTWELEVHSYLAYIREPGPDSAANGLRGN